MALKTYFGSSVGRKQVMAITGLGLSLFTLTHMAGNLLALVGPDAYNAYGNAIVTNPLLYVAEAGLVVLFLVHMILAARLTFENNRARSSRYFVQPRGDRGGTTLGARTMILSGLLVLVFLVLHLKTFKYGAHYTTTVNSIEMRDLYLLMQEVFRDPVYVVWYLVSLVVLGLHLSHGITSTFQSLGLNHPNINSKVRFFGYSLAAIITVGFMLVPICFYVRG